MNPTAPNQPLDIVLLYGGQGGEHDVSRLSAASIFHHLDPDRYRVHPVGVDRDGVWRLQGPWSPEEASAATSLPLVSGPGRRVAVVPGSGLFREDGENVWVPFRVDGVFNIVHGLFGEDGRIQGLLESAHVPCTGARVAASAVGMDKVFAKQIWQHYGLPVVPYRVAYAKSHRTDPRYSLDLFEETKKTLGLPLFVKPSNSGSSVGVTKVHSWETFVPALETAFAVDAKVLIEKAMTVQEVEVAVLDCPEPTAFGPGEIEPTHEFYDYDAKYLDPEGARLLIPARLDAKLAQDLLGTAVQAYRALDVQGFARVDFFVDKQTGRFFLNEINTLPGFTTISMFPRMAMTCGFSYAQVLDRIVEEALSRK